MKSELFYQDTQKGSATLILIHAFPLSHRMWDSQFQEFSEKYRVIRYDLRGFGRSSQTDGQTTIELHTDDLLNLMDTLNVQRAVLCGLSMGGYIALRFSERFSERVAGLILADTKSEADTNEGKLGRAAGVKVLKEKGSAALVEDLLKKLLGEKTQEHNTFLVEHVKEMALENSPFGMASALIALAGRTDTTAALSKFNFSTLVLVGAEDKITPPEFAERLKAGIKGAELEVIPDAGHLSNLENPARFNASVLKFLSSNFNA